MHRSNFYWIRDAASLPLLVHLPRSSTFIPPEIRVTFASSDEELEAELLVITDRYTDELFMPALSVGGTLFLTRVSRLAMDPERFSEDLDEAARRRLPDDAFSMTSKGMGPVYTHSSCGKRLRREIMRSFCYPYAEAMAEQVSLLLSRFGRCLIVDGHSFPSRIRPFAAPKSA